MKKKKVHIRCSRLFVNAGICYPKCIASQPLDVDFYYLTTSEACFVTCKACKKLLSKG